MDLVFFVEKPREGGKNEIVIFMIGFSWSLV